MIVQIELPNEDAWHLYALLQGDAWPKNADEEALITQLRDNPLLLEEKIRDTFKRLEAGNTPGQPGEA